MRLFVILFMIPKITTISLLSSILRKTVQNVNPYQITYFTSELVPETHKENTQNLEEYPTLKLASSNLQRLNFLSNSTVLNRTLQISLIIIYANGVSFAKQVIDFISVTVPLYERPKCLCILPNESLDYKKILLYSWENKILDFTVLREREMYYYDPFNNYFANHSVNPQTDLFPYKFQSMNNYLIKVGRGEKNINGTTVVSSLIELDKQKLALYYGLRTMKLDLDHINVNDSQYYDWRNNRLWFSVMKTNVLGGLVNARESIMPHVVSAELPCRAVYAIVPITFIPKTIFPINVLFYIIVVPGIMISFLLAARYFKITRESFEILDAVHMLMGQPMNFVPRTLINKINYLTITLLFVMISNNLYSSVVDLAFNKEEVEYESLDDLDRSGMLMYASSDEYKDLHSFHLDDPVTKRVDAKMGSKSDCLPELIKKRSYICIDWEYGLKRFIDTNRNTDGSAILKTASFQCDQMFVQFEPGSPYMKRFAVVNRRIRAAGLLEMANVLYGFIRRIEEIEVNEEKDKKNLSQRQILYILTIGYSMATVAFFIELIMSKYKKIKSKFRLWFARLHLRWSVRLTNRKKSNVSKIFVKRVKQGSKISRPKVLVSLETSRTFGVKKSSLTSRIFQSNS